MIIDPNPFVKHRIRENRPALAWNTHSPETEEWQMALRSRLDQILGNLSAWERVPLNPRISEVVEQDGYRREAVTFATRPGLDAFGYFLIPLANAANDYAGRRPTVLCLPGHGRGVASIIGVAEDGGQRLVGEPEEYANDFALQCLAIFMNHMYKFHTVPRFGFVSWITLSNTFCQYTMSNLLRIFVMSTQSLGNHQFFHRHFSLNQLL